MSLKEIFCQDKAISVLQRAFAADKLAHAYIFDGPEGVGKFRTACEWAKLILCENPVSKGVDVSQFADSCGACRSCESYEAGSHPDFNSVYKELREFTKDGKGKAAPVDLPIDVIREFLINKVSVKPKLSRRKVFVVSEAEKLNVSSQNSLLKVLEEPPEYCHILLLCTQMEKLLPTIKSRCQTIRFGLIAEQRIIERLRQMGLDDEKGCYFARLADGSLGLACQWAGLEMAEAGLFEIKQDLVNCLATYEYADALDVAERALANSKKIAAVWAKLDNTTSKTDIARKATNTLMQIIISALHDAMTISLSGPERIVNIDQLERIKQLAKRWQLELAAEKIIQVYEAKRWINSAVNERLILEQLLLNLGPSDTIKV